MVVCMGVCVYICVCCGSRRKCLMLPQLLYENFANSPPPTNTRTLWNCYTNILISHCVAVVVIFCSFFWILALGDFAVLLLLAIFVKISFTLLDLTLAPSLYFFCIAVLLYYENIFIPFHLIPSLSWLSRSLPLTHSWLVVILYYSIECNKFKIIFLCVWWALHSHMRRGVWSSCALVW